jgi:hypothetical protein
MAIHFKNNNKTINTFRVQDRDGSWRINELSELIENADIVRFIKNRRIAWLGNVMGMDEKRIPKRVIEWKPTGRRIRENLGKDGLKILKMEVRGWRKLSKERTGWRRITEKVKTHSGL